MATMPDSHENDEPLERTELVRRLRRMQWPPAPPHVKERVLQRLEAETERELGGHGARPLEPSDD